MTRDARRRLPLPHDRRVLLLAICAALPGSFTALFILWTGDYTPKVQWTLTVFLVAIPSLLVFALRERVVLPLQTLSNLIAALREGDFSIRARSGRMGDPLAEVMCEINALVDTLRTERLGALEATTLLRHVMAEIEVAVFTFDGTQRLQLVNRTGERLLARPAEQLLGRMAAELELEEFLRDNAPPVLAASFPGGAGRWAVRRSMFRQGGLPHQLLVLSDVSGPLREEERRAWQRLIRVLGHELNNSLTPITSISASLERLVSRDPLPVDWREDVQRGLGVMGARAEALARFMGAYGRLARLPPPTFQPLDVPTFVPRVAALETRRAVTIVAGPPITIEADGDQLEQVLINLLRNAVDAAMETGGEVRVGWSRLGGPRPAVEFWVEDEGPGIANPANLFVPFFTTKPGGTGIGLALSRQIAESHGGTLALENRQGATGARARLRLPIG